MVYHCESFKSVQELHKHCVVNAASTPVLVLQRNTAEAEEAEVHVKSAIVVAWQQQSQAFID